MQNVQQELGENFMVQQQIGKGAFATVYLGYWDNEPVAIKYFNKKAFSPIVFEYVRNEIDLIKKSKNDNIVSYRCHVETQNSLYLVLEYCEMNLHQVWLQVFQTKIPENYCIIFLRQIVNGLHYLHQYFIIHRDIKLDNILIKFQNNQHYEDFFIKKKYELISASKLKIADLGLAKQLKSEQDITQTFAGSRFTMAPEIQEKKEYGLSADIFSLGIITFQMLQGTDPFESEFKKPLAKVIEEQMINFEQDCSKEMQKLIKQMIQYDPNQRLTWEQLYNHKFFKKEILETQSMLDQTLDQNRKKYQEMQKSIKILSKQINPEEQSSNQKKIKIINFDEEIKCDQHLEIQKQSYSNQDLFENEKIKDENKISVSNKKKISIITAKDQFKNISEDQNYKQDQYYKKRNNYILILKAIDKIKMMKINEGESIIEDFSQQFDYFQNLAKEMFDYLLSQVNQSDESLKEIKNSLEEDKKLVMDLIINNSSEQQIQKKGYLENIIKSAKDKFFSKQISNVSKINKLNENGEIMNKKEFLIQVNQLYQIFCRFDQDLNDYDNGNKKQQQLSNIQCMIDILRMQKILDDDFQKRLGDSAKFDELQYEKILKNYNESVGLISDWAGMLIENIKVQK